MSRPCDPFQQVLGLEPRRHADVSRAGTPREGVDAHVEPTLLEVEAEVERNLLAELGLDLRIKGSPPSAEGRRRRDFLALFQNLFAEGDDAGLDALEDLEDSLLGGANCGWKGRKGKNERKKSESFDVLFFVERNLDPYESENQTLTLELVEQHVVRRRRFGVDRLGDLLAQLDPL